MRGHEIPVVDAVVFDMDGLLLDTEILARRANMLAGQELGLGLTEDFCALLIGVPVDGNRRLLLEHYGQSVPVDAFFAAVARHFQGLVDGGAIALKPGVGELLDQLKEVGLPCAVATSSARTKALHHLQLVGISQRFQAIITRDDVARGKPYPDLFLRAAEVLRAPPERCLALEDSYNGVRAAHAAGMPVIMVPDLLPATEEMRHKCFAIAQDLHEVSVLLVRQRQSSERAGGCFQPAVLADQP